MFGDMIVSGENTDNSDGAEDGEEEYLDPVKPLKKTLDSGEIREHMLKDPEAGKFLEDIMPGAKRMDYSQNLDVTAKLRIKSKKKLPAQDYKWPYYDSYVPGLGMNDKDKRVVKKGIQRQYFPNEQGNFNFKEMKSRKKAIKQIEHQYIDRIKQGYLTPRNVTLPIYSARSKTTKTRQ